MKGTTCKIIQRYFFFENAQDYFYGIPRNKLMKVSLVVQNDKKKKNNS